MTGSPSGDAPFGRRVVVAPMAGGPTTTELVVACVDAGAIGFLAGGYRSAADLRGQILEVRARTEEPFGVNVFVPGAPADREPVDRYLDSLASDAAALGTTLGDAVWDDDDWQAKVELLVEEAPPVVSFTFGVPPAEIVAELHHAGSLVLVTVTTPEEARSAWSVGARWVVAQGVEAGAHRGSHENRPGADSDWTTLALTAEIRRATSLQVIASGGLTTASSAAAAVAAGASAVQSGTAFLLCPEAGTHPSHRDALTDPANTTTRVTRAFSGRPARGIVNPFIARHADAPAAYPELNNATRPLRKAAADAGDTSMMSLWAGQSFRSARARAAGEVVAELESGARRGLSAR